MKTTEDERLVGFICDKAGREYALFARKTTDILWLKVRDGGRPIARASCTICNRIWTLDDLFIEDGTPKRLFGFEIASSDAKNYRREGIGTAFLEWIVSAAQREGGKQIKGHVVRRDYDGNPDLLEWYKRKGFKVMMEPSGTNVIARISMDLN